MTSDSPHIAWFAEVGRDDVSLVGGKGANLGELTQAKIPVPPGFVVTTHAYREFIEDSGLDRTLRRILDGLDVDDERELTARAAAVQHAIKQAEMPAVIQQAITAAYTRLGEGPVAVRSSATAEDLAEASFAGQQATFLNIEGGVNVVEAVQRCWASLFEPRAIFYREQAGWGHLDVDLAVPVQRMVQSESSGVMFTIDPITNDANQIVIEAAFGLGEAVVGGLVSPDHFEVDKAAEQIVTRQIFRQDRKLVRSPDGLIDPEYGANSWRALSDAEGSAPKLSDGQVVALSTIGKRIESHYGWPQDIEWGWADNQFYLLQTRPITTVAPTARRNGDNPAPTPEAAPILDGSPASPGIASGRIRVILDARETSTVGEGDVLVAEMTTPDFVPRDEARRRNHHRARRPHLPRGDHLPRARRALRRRRRRRGAARRGPGSHRRRYQGTDLRRRPARPAQLVARSRRGTLRADRDRHQALRQPRRTRDCRPASRSGTWTASASCAPSSSSPASASIPATSSTPAARTSTSAASPKECARSPPLSTRVP